MRRESTTPSRSGRWDIPPLYRAKWKEYNALWEGRRNDYVESCKRDIVALARKFEHDVVPVSWCRHAVSPRAARVFVQIQVAAARRRVYAFSPQSEGHAFLLSHPDFALEQIEDIPLDFDESHWTGPPRGQGHGRHAFYSG